MAVLVDHHPATGQNAPTAVPLDAFFRHVVHLWSINDVPSIVQLIPLDASIPLDTGSGIQNANGRHAAAALRALFAESETVGTRAVRITVASTRPARGFGELAWDFRVRGAPGELSRSVYIAAAWVDDAWRITELRLMP